jgi:RNA polymerase sigma-70 factor (ECF subfamily)
VVYRRCLRLLRDGDAAADATQEVFVQLVRNMKALEDRATVLPWIYRVATNHCLNALRDARRRGTNAREEDPPEVVIGGADGLPGRQLAQRVLSHFDTETQAIAVGVLVDGMGHEEVAGVLGISRRTVHRKLANFLDRAKRLITGSET